MSSKPAAKHCSLVLLRTDQQVLLAMKKRGFGKDRWNGVGGKIEPGETIMQACVRETQEEIAVTPLQLTKVAQHTFVFPDHQADMIVHTFECWSWKGEPTESEEMAPQWFDIQDVPYNQMWQDDLYWMPAVFGGKRLITEFTFDTNEQLIAGMIRPVDEVE